MTVKNVAGAVVVLAGVSVGMPSESFDYFGAAAPHDMDYNNTDPVPTDPIMPVDTPQDPYVPDAVVPVDDGPAPYMPSNVVSVDDGPTGYDDSAVVPDTTGPSYGDYDPSAVVPDSWDGPGYGGDAVVSDGWDGPGYGDSQVVPTDTYDDIVDDWFGDDPIYETGTTSSPPYPTDACSIYDVDDIYSCLDPDYIDIPICEVQEMPVYETVTTGEPECVDVVYTETYTSTCESYETVYTTEYSTVYETCDEKTEYYTEDYTSYTCAGTKTVYPPAHTEYLFEYQPVYIHPVEYVTYTDYITPDPTTKTTSTVSETVKETPVVYSTIWETVYEKVEETQIVTKPGSTVYEPTYSTHYGPAPTETVYKVIALPYGCLEPVVDPYDACPTATWGGDYPEASVVPDDFYPAPSYGTDAVVPDDIYPTPSYGADAVVPDSTGPSYGEVYDDVVPIDTGY